MKAQKIFTKVALILCFSAGHACEEKTEAKNRIIPVAGITNLYSKPKATTGVIKKMEPGWFVVEMNDIRKVPDRQNGQDGNWIFVDTGNLPVQGGETIKGWVFDAYLGYPERFKKPISLMNKSRKFSYLAGDLSIKYHLVNGQFTYRYCAETDEGGQCVESKKECKYQDEEKKGLFCVGNGTFLKYMDLFWARRPNSNVPTPEQVFRRGKSGEFCSVYDERDECFNLYP